MKTVLILQAWGLGDIIWSQSIAHHFIEKGYRVVWPVKDIYFRDVCAAYPQINWVPDSLIQPEMFNIKEKIDLNGITVAPIRWSDSYMKVPYKNVMRAKYDMYELDWQTWRIHATWQRNFQKELELFNLVGLSQGESYTLVNMNFGSHTPREIQKPLISGRYIEMKPIPGYSIFDWDKIIMDAKEIHTVSTSLLYMLEVLPLTQPIHLYVRKPIEKDFSFVDYIFTKNYQLHL